MKRIYYSLLCLLAFLQVGIAQTREIKTFSGQMGIPSKELVKILDLSGNLYDCEAQYYEVDQKENILGMPKRVFHGRFNAKIIPFFDNFCYSPTDTLRVEGQFQEGKMVGRWQWLDVFVDVKNEKYTFTLNDTIKRKRIEFYELDKPEKYIVRRAKVVNSRLTDTLYYAKVIGDEKDELIIPIDEGGFAHGICIFRRTYRNEERYRYHHGVCVAKGTINTQTGEQTTKPHAQMDQIIKGLNPNTGECVINGKCYMRKSPAVLPFDAPVSVGLFWSMPLMDWLVESSLANLEPCKKHQINKETKKNKWRIYKR